MQFYSASFPNSDGSPNLQKPCLHFQECRVTNFYEEILDFVFNQAVANLLSFFTDSLFLFNLEEKASNLHYIQHQPVKKTNQTLAHVALVNCTSMLYSFCIYIC